MMGIRIMNLPRRSSAEGASHTSLGQRPRRSAEQMEKGCKPAPWSR
jgi:hypothetical protein